jgi:hypothetical protein
MRVNIGHRSSEPQPITHKALGMIINGPGFDATRVFRLCLADASFSLMRATKAVPDVVPQQPG